MRTKVIEEDADKEPTTLSRLENAICDVCSMVTMLAATLDYCDALEEEKREAITFGVYRVQAMLRETKELFTRLGQEVAQVRAAQDEVVPLEDDEPA
jgi:hypothetical protein